MGDLQGLGQGTNLRWKAASDQDEDGHPSSALRRPHASKLAKPGLPVRPRSVYPPFDLPSTARSDSIPVYERAVSDVSALSEDTNPFSHIQSSMGRLSLQNSGGISRKMPLRGIRESTAGGHLDRDDTSSESESDGSTGSASLPETHPPISIRSHVAAQLKKPDQDRNGMRIRRSHGFGPSETSSAKDMRTLRMEKSDHYLPTTAKEIEGNGSLPEHGNMTSYMRQGKQRPVFGRPGKVPGHGPGLSHNYVPTIQNFHPGQDAQMFPPVPRNYHRKEALDSADGRYAAPRPGKKYHVSTGDRRTLPGLPEAKYMDPYAHAKSVSLSKFKPAWPLTSGESFDKNVVTTSGNARAPTYADPYGAEQRPLGWIGRFNPDLDRAVAPGETRMPAVHLNVSPPPPYAPYMGMIPMPPPPPEDRISIRRREPPPGWGPPNFTSDQDSETALPRASNKSLNNSSDAVFDCTTGISFTISKDSSADECVRQARLFADMGERNQGPATRAESIDDYTIRVDGPATLAVPGLVQGVAGRNYPTEPNDVLNDFDFNSFLHDNKGDTGAFGFSNISNFMNPDPELKKQMRIWQVLKDKQEKGEI